MIELFVYPLNLELMIWLLIWPLNCSLLNFAILVYRSYLFQAVSLSAGILLFFLIIFFPNNRPVLNLLSHWASYMTGLVMVLALVSSTAVQVLAYI